MKEIYKNLFIADGAVNLEQFSLHASSFAALKGCGALSIFHGLVRDDDNISALSFNIYESLFIKWFKSFEQKYSDAYFLLAHSIGDVEVSKSSYSACVVSKHRDISLKLFPLFVESFKKEAPIWKFNIINGERIFASKNSFSLPFSGLLA